MHNLSGVYVQYDGERVLDSRKYYVFSILLPNLTKVLLTDTKEECDEWINKIRIVTGYEDLKEIYEMKETLGEGRYGKVKKCIQKTTKREAAVKIVSKKLMKPDQLQQLNTEIEILKLCQHPNIIKLYDIFENQDYMYISKNF